MNIKTTHLKSKIYFTLLLTFTFFAGHAQIGIGTITPNSSSILDITSTDKGMLAPRMTTAQRNAISSPADGLLVYDTDLKLFYYYLFSTTKWTPVNSGVTARENFKRIKAADDLSVVLAAELAAGGGSKYELDPSTLYEINGLISFNYPIELNNAYIQGLDTNEDIISRASGNLFDGATGGSIKSVTLNATGGKVFNLSGTATQNLILRDCIVANSNTVGSVSGFGLVFCSIVQFSNNTNGITYNNISQLLLSNMGWFGNNSGTYEKLTGTFSLVEKQGGFSKVDATSIGFDVSASGLTVGDGVLESVVFTGTNSAGYVNPYTTGTYPGYNFNNNWNVNSPGIPEEGDANATGGFAVDFEVGTGDGVTFTDNTTRKKVGSMNTSTTYSNLFRFASNSTIANRLIYKGKNQRIFQVSGSISFQVSAAGTYIIYIAKNGSVLSEYKVYGRGLVANDIVVLPLNASVLLAPDDYVEVYAQRYSVSIGDIIVPNMTLTLK
ncbi:hypothetical protein [Flavobacterium algicola]|uniref:hypothetical protein n=1 Tax=Flavobacterium algicola TaxID=556529 RepID=UPI001EFD4646|nr:hypothetical protein [Flavobacterium algicola]MCG9793545.1 hypothetical protein [Flavobacterium algicola]